MTFDHARALTKLQGFRWVAGLAVHHVSTPLRILHVEEDDFLDAPYTVLHCWRAEDQRVYAFRDEGETFPDLMDEVTAAYCQMAIASGMWYAPSPPTPEENP